MQEKSEIFYKILQNGLKIVVKPTTSEVAYVGIMVGAGTRDEREEENGLAHYVEHTVFKGTQNHTARQIIVGVEGVGGEINAYTTKEETTYYAATPVGHWKQTLRIIAEMVTCPTFPDEETDKEKDVILDEIDSYEDSLSELIYDDFEGMLFEGSTLGRRILGTKKSVRHIAKHRELAERWIAELYTPERMVVFAQGRLEPNRFCQEVEKIFGNRTQNLGSIDLRYIFDKPSIRLQGRIDIEKCGDLTQKLRCKTMGKHTHQVHGMLGGLAYPLGHEKQLTAYLLNNILGGGALNSRLNLSLREKYGLVYSVDSQYVPLSDTGYWNVYFACDPKDKDRCVELVEREQRRLREERLSTAQLTRHLKQLHGQMAISAENQENNVLTMAKNMLYFGRSRSWQESYARIAEIKSDQLQDCANEIFQEEQILRLFYDKM